MSRRTRLSFGLFLLLPAAMLAAAPTTGWALTTERLIAPVGAANNDQLGASVAAADLNGDGYTDLIAGAKTAGSGLGHVHVYFGGPGASDATGILLTGQVSGDDFGYSVDSAGDMNGDGYPEVIVGAPFAGTGHAYVYFGGPTMDATPDLVLTGAAGSDGFGISVASAGDVNGDGFGDVIVGAPFNDAGGGNAGRVYVFFGGPGADSVPDLIVTGKAAGDEFGYSAGGAGDVNGDGVGDLVVGALGNDTAGAAAGQAYVFFGSAAGDTVADLIFNGEAAGDELGYAVGAAGDVNGDGYDDVLVGAPFNDAGGNSAGRVYVFYGGPIADSVPDLVLTGAAAGDNLGSALARAGDLNADGYGDIVAGAPLHHVGIVAVGAAYVYFGGPAPDTVPDLILTGEEGSDQFGFSVKGAGDFDGDGFEDLAVGALFNDLGGSSAGRAYLYSVYPYRILSPNGGESWVAGDRATVRWKGHDPADLFVSTDGGATWETVAVGVGGGAENAFTLPAPGIPSDFARVRVSYTAQSPSRSTSDESDRLFRIVGPAAPVAARLQLSGGGEAAGDRLGSAVATAGDFNGDGFADVIAGAILNDAAGTSAGRAYVHFGGPGADPVPDLILTGEAAGDEFGKTVGPAGDVNGDGYDDLIVGAPFNDAAGSSAGRAYVYLGGPGADAVPDLVFTGAVAADELGLSAAGAGDFNGDGYDDLIIAAPGSDVGGGGAGQAYLFLGGPSPNNVVDLTFTGAAAGDDLGFSVAGAGDVNGDGYDDVIAGAPLADTGGSNAGAAYVYFGGPGADSVPDLVLVGQTPADEYGYVVAGAGDVNGDGYDDVVVSTPVNDAGGNNAGRAYVYFGGPAPDADPDLILTGEAAGDEFGASAGPAGDVNGDGFDDLIIGAPLNASGGSSAGRAYVFYGGPVPDAVPDFIVTGTAIGSQLGAAVGRGETSTATGSATW